MLAASRGSCRSRSIPTTRRTDGCSSTTRTRTATRAWSSSTADPAAAVADPASAKELLAVEQPSSNHNGGQLAFGPDGLLYVGMGDGGGSGDPNGNGQDTSRASSASSSRLDVDASGADWQMQAYGLRNPWRFSFDRETGVLYIGDVGQGAWEEIDAVAWPADKLLNFGWNVFEGAHEFSGGEPNPGGTARRSRSPSTTTTRAPARSRAGSSTAAQAMPGPAAAATSTATTARARSGRSACATAAPSSAWQAPFTVASLTSFGEDPAGELSSSRAAAPSPASSGIASLRARRDQP